MNKIISMVMLMSLVCAMQVMAFEEDKFRSTLEAFNKVSVPVAAGVEKGSGDIGSGSKGNAGNDDFVWLKADKINQQLELLVRGIENAKGVAAALAVISNLYSDGKISVDVALTAIQILKLRAVFLRVFITNGDSELEVMIHILNEHETAYSDMVSSGPKNN